ncbi:UDP-glucosyltransferase 2-like [Bradysia coprophila]|uniref:UDP-glucosyltransferase 2-like n=1 Tax=Bradysia coprophila TaxID=38358 RepID=UPI00187DC9B4|nr:UDP-glucosyltransferase 2-like [Bradysia coprophila]
MKLHGYCIVILCLIQLDIVWCAKILGFFATVSQSHFIVEEPVMRELAKRGHDVTVVTSYKQSGEPLKNYRYIDIPDFINRPEIESFRTSATSGNSIGLAQRYTMMKELSRMSLDLMNHDKFLPLKNETFDLLVLGWFMNDYALGLSGHFKCPSVIISPNVNFYTMRKLAGNPSSISTIPGIMVDYATPMTFFQRLKNIGYYLIEFAFLEGANQVFVAPLYTEAFPPNQYPTYDEVLRNVSLILVSQHFSGRTPEPLLPNVIEVEGMHVKKEPSPLPEDIKAFLDGAAEGVIFFSLGSNARSSDLSEERIAVFVNKFRGLKQRVLWKFETDLPDLPDNVKIGKWLPQDDILAHPNIKLFISHCGKGGITEAKYHGVPILGIPLFADQFVNAEHIAEEGWAKVLPLNDLNPESFSSALAEALNNPSYGNVVKKLSNLNRDRPEHPLDKAAFWIEYVIRHNGAKHMQSPAVHLNVLQFYMVDTISFILAALYVTIKLTKFLFKLILRKVFRRGHEKSKKE